MVDSKTIVVDLDTYTVLVNHGKKGETFDTLVRRCMRRAGWLK